MMMSSLCDWLQRDKESETGPLTPLSRRKRKTIEEEEEEEQEED